MNLTFKKSIILILILFISVQTIFSTDIKENIVGLIQSLSAQYREKAEDLYLKTPIAVLPFVEDDETSEEYNLGTVCEELVRNELVNSTIFLLTERKNMDAIVEEMKLSLSGMTSAYTSVEIGEITGAKLFIAGSIAKSGNIFMLNARLISVETAEVIAAESINIPADALIEVSKSPEYSYVFKYGLGMNAGIGMDYLLQGMPDEGLDSTPLMLDSELGVTYRPWPFLQLCGSFHTTWGEYQYGEFDPQSASFGNNPFLRTYYINVAATPLPRYSFEYSQNYINLGLAGVINPLKKLTLSLGAGGIFGLAHTMIKLHDLPIYIGPWTNLWTPEEPVLAGNWQIKDVILNSGNAMFAGFTAALKAEYYFSPRFLCYLNVRYKKTFGGDPHRYLFGGYEIGSGSDDTIQEIGGWIPDLTPYGESLQFDLDSITIQLGISFSF